MVSKHLYLQHKLKDEFFFTKKRSEIVSRENLNIIGKKIIPKSLINHKLNKIPNNIYGNIIESIIGAIYLDLGEDYARQFVIKQIIQKTEDKESNYKSKIIEWCQKNNKKINFIKNQQSGPQHLKRFFIQLFIDEHFISEAWGETIKKAEQKSAKIAYAIIS